MADPASESHPHLQVLARLRSPTAPSEVAQLESSVGLRICRLASASRRKKRQWMKRMSSPSPNKERSPRKRSRRVASESLLLEVAEESSGC
jgi:hypothetical protein